MNAERYAVLHTLMLAMPVWWRYRWCKTQGGCGCIEGANCSGGLSRHGFTEEE